MKRLLLIFLFGNLLYFISLFAPLQSYAAECNGIDFGKGSGPTCTGQGSICVDLTNPLSECYQKTPPGYKISGSLCRIGVLAAVCMDPAGPTPTPTDIPGCTSTPGQNCGIGCCRKNGLVCINETPNSRVQTKSVCLACSLTENQQCNPGGSDSSASNCCQPGLFCTQQTSGNYKCTKTTNQPTITLHNPCANNTTCPTALGDIPVDPAGFVQVLFRIILSLSGGIAMIMIVYSGYRLAVSSGNPERVQHARETLISAIVGLLFILFSLTILQIIGVDILGLGTKGGEVFFQR